MINNLIRCSACDNSLGGNGKVMYGLRIPDGMITFSFGELGFILTKKIFIGVILLILSILMVYYRIKTIGFGHSHNHEIS
jgi:hypothetical protein